MNDFLTESTKAMNWLASQPNTIFLGQSVGVEGTKLYASVKGIPRERRLEMPVAEELQLGISLGLSLQGFVPVSIFPRFNFLICAANQLINHLDRLSIYSSYQPKVIVRVSCGSGPLNAGPQHTDDFTAPLKLILKTVEVKHVNEHNVVREYQAAYSKVGSTILVE